MNNLEMANSIFNGYRILAFLYVVVFLTIYTNKILKKQESGEAKDKDLIKFSIFDGLFGIGVFPLLQFHWVKKKIPKENKKLRRKLNIVFWSSVLVGTILNIAFVGALTNYANQQKGNSGEKYNYSGSLIKPVTKFTTPDGNISVDMRCPKPTENKNETGGRSISKLEMKTYKCSDNDGFVVVDVYEEIAEDNLDRYTNILFSKSKVNKKTPIKVGGYDGYLISGESSDGKSSEAAITVYSYQGHVRALVLSDDKYMNRMLNSLTIINN